LDSFDFEFFASHYPAYFFIKVRPIIVHPIERIKIPAIATYTERSGPSPYIKAPTKIRIPPSFGKLIERMRAIQKSMMPRNIVMLAITLNVITSALFLIMKSRKRNADSLCDAITGQRNISQVTLHACKIYAISTKNNPSNPTNPDSAYNFEYTALKPKIISITPANAPTPRLIQFGFKTSNVKSAFISFIGSRNGNKTEYTNKRTEPSISEMPPSF
jgi:hypothetical protein